LRKTNRIVNCEALEKFLFDRFFVGIDAINIVAKFVQEIGCPSRPAGEIQPFSRVPSDIFVSMLVLSSNRESSLERFSTSNNLAQRSALRMKAALTHHPGSHNQVD
jgi:hypothetical protein